MNMFSSFQRDQIINTLEMEAFDVLVIGGGITGAGIALDAITRGLKTGVIEMQDFAAGTSSRSTKLVHGGLRYLKQFELKMVGEVGKERAIVYENGPHVTRPEWMMLPFYKGSTLGSFTTNIGLMLYDWLADVKKEERRKMLSAQQAINKEPLIKQDGLLGAGVYVEYKTDDARLTIEVLKKAAEYGAHAINYMKAVDFIYDETGRITGVLAKDVIKGTKHAVKAKKIINATGPWVDTLRELDHSKKEKALHLTKGVHVVFPKSIFPLKQAIYFDSPDGRMIFAIPRDGKTYVGTTDTDYEGDKKHPVMEKEEAVYLLDAINFMFPSLNLKLEHVESSWAGLRPLIAEDEINHPSEISRKDEIFVSDTGLISMAGGKLTGYRKMAEQAVDIMVNQLKAEEGILYSSSETKTLPISGGEVGGSSGFESFKKRKLSEGIEMGIEKTQAELLVERYGKNVNMLYGLYQKYQQDAVAEKIDPIVFIQLIYALENELAYHPSDFFVRRTGALFFDISMVKREKKAVIQYMAKCLSWSEEEKERYTADINHMLQEAEIPH
ncbi:glycerol-3-phosphate dehydrogenase/oxidase [Oceanobacillus halophilus]|uniref:Glycerol-3-phosphate dehydrogenase n=1 Tax=Oceanobacillus halophilus TaxID=930130 RepID=A0A495A741_9BACI|nr:FAD-dependent oxidoreductase [Oceanobacillus halophilus]RKQ35553.1 glycerol-3-phosphate dehydrogenase/oxidase [Oceanobacillus halophilus]